MDAACFLLYPGRVSVEDDLETRLRTRLDPLDRPPQRILRGDRDLNAAWEEPKQFRDAAVLAPIVMRPDGWTLLFTERAADLPSHPGQISFPGGRVEAGESAVDAALREAEEEISLPRALVRPLGGFGLYETGTGFRITPVAALVEPDFVLKPDPREVASVFEAPLAFLMDAANHELREGERNGVKRRFYAMTYGQRFIWGATAGMIRALYERLYL